MLNFKASVSSVVLSAFVLSGLFCVSISFVQATTKVDQQELSITTSQKIPYIASPKERKVIGQLNDEYIKMREVMFKAMAKYGNVAIAKSKINRAQFKSESISIDVFGKVNDEIYDEFCENYLKEVLPVHTSFELKVAKLTNSIPKPSKDFTGILQSIKIELEVRVQERVNKLNSELNPDLYKK